MTPHGAGPSPLVRRAPPIRFDDRLVEDAVLLAVDGAPKAARRSFHAARDPVYELAPERREDRFRKLHAAWFDRLGLADRLVSLLAERPSIARSVAECLVVAAARRKEEHADLRRRRAPERGGRRSAAGARGEPCPPVLVVHLLPATLIDAARLARLLRRELCFVADMLDPEFGYDPELAVDGTSGPLATLLRERHQLLWRVSVDGRLAARGELPEAEAAELRLRLGSAFRMLPDAGEAIFRALFEGPRPSHRELMRLARHPAGAAGGSGECPLCRLPAPGDRLERDGLPEHVVAAALRDFADWRPEDGLCPHCADLYDLRARAHPSLA